MEQDAEGIANMDNLDGQYGDVAEETAELKQAIG